VTHQQLTKSMKRLKSAGLARVRSNNTGRGAKASEIILPWDKLSAVASGAKFRGWKRPAAADKPQPPKTADQPAATKPGPPPAEKPTWDAERGELRLARQVWRVAKQAKRIRDVLIAFNAGDWPERVSSPASSNPQAHHDAIRSLNKCPFLKFSSAYSGTMIAWKTQ
jgi:hypothetical protein